MFTAHAMAVASVVTVPPETAEALVKAWEPHAAPSVGPEG